MDCALTSESKSICFSSGAFVRVFITSKETRTPSSARVEARSWQTNASVYPTRSDSPRRRHRESLRGLEVFCSEEKSAPSQTMGKGYVQRGLLVQAYRAWQNKVNTQELEGRRVGGELQVKDFRRKMGKKRPPLMETHLRK